MPSMTSIDARTKTKPGSARSGFPNLILHPALRLRTAEDPMVVLERSEIPTKDLLTTTATMATPRSPRLKANPATHMFILFILLLQPRVWRSIFRRHMIVDCATLTLPIRRWALLGHDVCRHARRTPGSLAGDVPPPSAVDADRTEDGAARQAARHRPLVTMDPAVS